MIEFIIPGQPVAQARPRAGKIQRGKKRGQTVLYDPQESKNYKNYVSIIAKQHAPKIPFEGALQVSIKIYRQIPKSTTKKDRALFLAGIKRPVTKADTSNYVKGIEDALNGIIYKDDSQIVDLYAAKYYSDNPRVEISVREIDEIAIGGML
ncbi:RusA family crossover junction endodeoxyribonuclease [Virgibacillus halodenitrificans]|uniref:RusA family crossover junction endodeoxyribonuclease n=1 Tax=Virgibacillus halodenitrificans TaxID=1482 RepID=UPI0013CEF7B3|nr:RusA family crossover junction endodeoxyribonuclease [Virgibacillus halodenitrificans]